MLKHATYLTNRKLLLSLGVAVGAVLFIAIGVSLHNAITNGAEEKARLYQYALQTQGDEQFNYSIDTKQGNVLAVVTVSPVDLVKFDEMNKEFVKVKKTKERYTRHERTVCETKYRTETVYDSTTGTSSTEQVPYEECHQETYYTWDEIDRWEKEAKEVDMAGRKYPLGLFAFGTGRISAKDIIPGQTGEYVREEANTWIDLNFGDDEGDIRYGYEVLSLPRSGTVFLSVTDGVKPVFGSRIVLEGKNPTTLVTEAQKAAQTQGTVFTWFWSILVIISIGVCLYFVWFYESY